MGIYGARCPFSKFSFGGLLGIAANEQIVHTRESLLMP
jgi:hypothetical protein